jgi:hypothetical protein
MKLLVPILLLTISCSNKEANTTEFNKFIYQFHDSSVPPEYHRSFTITMTHDSISKMVDSYGDTISYQVNKIERSKFEDLKKIVKESELKNRKPTGQPGCSGGTGVSIYCFNKQKIIFEGYASFCGGKNIGDMTGNFEKILNFLNSLIPKIN